MYIILLCPFYRLLFNNQAAGFYLAALECYSIYKDSCPVPFVSRKLAALFELAFLTGVSVLPGREAAEI